MASLSDVERATLKDLLSRGLQGGELQAILAEVSPPSPGTPLSSVDDDGFEVLSGMTDASKRRMVSPEESGFGDVKVVARASSSPSVAMPGAAPAGALVPLPDEILLPSNVSSVTDWGTTIMEIGKYKGQELSYEELRGHSDPEVQRYVGWLCKAVSEKFKPQYRDFVAYVKIANTAFVSNRDVIPGSSQIRRRKGGT